MHTPTDLKYSEQHGWVKLDGQEATVGVTDFAQEELGEIVFVELPKVGQTIQAGESFGSMESVKTVSELYSPLSGKVIRVNESLVAKPGHVNESPYGEGWMVVIALSDEAELEQLWSAQRYADTYGQD